MRSNGHDTESDDEGGHERWLGRRGGYQDEELPEFTVQPSTETDDFGDAPKLPYAPWYETASQDVARRLVDDYEEDLPIVERHQQEQRRRALESIASRKGIPPRARRAPTRAPARSRSRVAPEYERSIEGLNDELDDAKDIQNLSILNETGSRRREAGSYLRHMMGKVPEETKMFPPLTYDERQAPSRLKALQKRQPRNERRRRRAAGEWGRAPLVDIGSQVDDRDEYRMERATCRGRKKQKRKVSPERDLGRYPQAYGPPPPEYQNYFNGEPRRFPRVSDDIVTQHLDGTIGKGIRMVCRRHGNYACDHMTCSGELGPPELVPDTTKGTGKGMRRRPRCGYCGKLGHNRTSHGRKR